jgi:hypothetical protein
VPAHHSKCSFRLSHIYFSERLPRVEAVWKRDCVIVWSGACFERQRYQAAMAWISGFTPKIEIIRFIL